MVTYLVTGGAGFIGSNICAELVKRGARVRILDNFSTGRMENISTFLDKVELIEGDIRDLKVVERAVKDSDYILHQAALPSVSRSIEDPFTTNEVNVKGTLNILYAAKELRVKRVIFASSSSVYGDTPLLPKSEEMATHPLSPYAVTKVVGEEYCKVFYRLFGLETVVLRYFNVFGPRQDPSSLYAAVIPKFITALLRRESPEIYGDGEQSRDFTYVDDIVRANLLATTTPGVGGQVFNIGCGRRILVKELAKKINDLLGLKIVPSFSQPRLGDIRHSLADISKAECILGYTPQVPFEEGLKKTIGWFLERQEGLRCGS